MTNVIEARTKMFLALALSSAIGTAMCWTLYAMRGVEIADDGMLVESFHLLALGWLFAAIAAILLALSLLVYVWR